MDPGELERAVDRALRALPGPKAPPTLLPRVMASVRAAQAPRARTWFTWPLGWQLASAAALVVLISGMAWLLPSAAAAIHAPISGVASDAVARVQQAAEDARQLASATSILWRTFLQPLVKVAFVLVLMMCGACAAFGTALSRVALGGASQ
jgi:hypothetical protein